MAKSITMPTIVNEKHEKRRKDRRFESSMANSLVHL